MKRYLLIIVMIFTFFVGYKCVNAYTYTNNNSTYNITIPEVNYFNELIDSTHTYQEVFDSLHSIQSNYYYLVIQPNFSSSSYNINSFSFILIPKTYSNFSFSIFGDINTSGYNPYDLYLNMFSDTYFYILYYFDFYSSNIGSDFYENNDYLSFYNCFINNVCSSNSPRALSNSNVPSYTLSDNTTSYINSIDVDFILSPIGYFYSTQVPFTYSQNRTNSYSSEHFFYKNISINGIDIEVGDSFPTYYDLYHAQPDVPVLDDFKDLNSNLLFRVNVSDVSNFEYSFEFSPSSLNLPLINGNYYTIDDYYNSFSYSYKVFGSKWTNDEYVQYDELNCILDFNNSIINNSIGVDSILSDVDNLSCSSSLSDYTNIHIFVDYSYSDSNLSTSILNPKVDITSNVVQSILFRYDNSGLKILDKFTGLSSRFKMFLSSSTFSSANIYSPNNSLFAQAYSIGTDVDNEFLKTLYQGNLPFYLSYGYIRGYNYLVYNDFDNYSLTTDIDIITDVNSFISFSYTYNDNNFSYIDNSGNIDSTDLFVNYDFSNILNTDNYDLSYYFGQVDNYINGFQNEILTFSNLVQTVYDGFPEVLRTFIFVIFILICVYATYLLIKR